MTKGVAYKTEEERLSAIKETSRRYRLRNKDKIAAKRKREAEKSRIYQIKYRSNPENRERHNVLNTNARHKKYGVTRPMPENCECCGKPFDKLKLDHDHDNDKFRGWLCHSCNVGIGALGDNLDGVLRAMNYLRLNPNL